MTIHLLYGAEPFLIREHRNAILEGVDPFTISWLDMRETTLQSAIEEARTMDLFGDTKTLILRDCYFLSTEVSKSKLQHDLDMLLGYIDSPNPSTTLILIVSHEKLDKRKKVVKSLLKVANTFEAKPLRYVQSFIQDRFKLEGKTISKDALFQMEQQLGYDLFLLHNEIQKLGLAYPDANQIEAWMLEEVMSRTLESDVFKLIERIIRKQASALTILEDLFRLGEDAIKINLLIARQFRMIAQVKAAQAIGQKPSSIIKANPFVINIAEEQADLYSTEEVQSRLIECAELDVSMKRGLVDKQIALETAIIKWI
ncbi:DNA polymerase III subunit delta [Psychrobacillus sp. FSL H8-0484]|uniref:DNA polymerase III subunit delta n=1 Tax=Psychrobacillus sp. FSL H8-0484 TaxID=2921390 RepID=UPI0030F66535